MTELPPDNTDDPGNDQDGMVGWMDLERAAWKQRMAEMVAANEEAVPE